jgi:hypothetical protein
MDTELFLMRSPAAKRVRLPARVVIGRGAHSLRDVRAIAEAGTFSPAFNPQPACELEVAGLVVARGRIVRKGGRLFFKVTEIEKRNEGGAE